MCQFDDSFNNCNLSLLYEQNIFKFHSKGTLCLALHNVGHIRIAPKKMRSLQKITFFDRKIYLKTVVGDVINYIKSISWLTNQERPINLGGRTTSLVRPKYRGATYRQYIIKTIFPALY